MGGAAAGTNNWYSAPWHVCRGVFYLSASCGTEIPLRYRYWPLAVHHIAENSAWRPSAMRRKAECHSTKSPQFLLWLQKIMLCMFLSCRNHLTINCLPDIKLCRQYDVCKEETGEACQYPKSFWWKKADWTNAAHLLVFGQVVNGCEIRHFQSAGQKPAWRLIQIISLKNLWILALYVFLPSPFSTKTLLFATGSNLIYRYLQYRCPPQR